MRETLKNGETRQRLSTQSQCSPAQCTFSVSLFEPAQAGFYLSWVLAAKARDPFIEVSVEYILLVRVQHCVL